MSKILLTVCRTHGDLYSTGKIIASMDIDKPLVVTVEEETRTLEQNKAQWPILSAISAQRKWPVDGELVFLDADSWKDILTAAYRKEVPKVVKAFSLGTENNYDKGSVMIGQRTSKFKHGEFSEWLEFLNAAAAELGVRVTASKSFMKANGIDV